MPGRISEKMMEALCCFLKGRKAVWEDGLDAEEWAEFFRLSQHHQILPFCAQLHQGGSIGVPGGLFDHVSHH